ncbi:hypothetical protein Trydic_g15594 [Trypoxylus dichotomus]
MRQHANYCRLYYFDRNRIVGLCEVVTNVGLSSVRKAAEEEPGPEEKPNTDGNIWYAIACECTGTWNGISPVVGVGVRSSQHGRPTAQLATFPVG